MPKPETLDAPIEDRLEEQEKNSDYYDDSMPEFVTVERSLVRDAVVELRRLRRIVDRRQANDARRPLLDRQEGP